jgi:hypothetical protein
MHADLPSSNGTAPKRDLVQELRIIGETLANLTYLTSMEADQPECVRRYMKIVGDKHRSNAQASPTQ